MGTRDAILDYVKNGFGKFGIVIDDISHVNWTSQGPTLTAAGREYVGYEVEGDAVDCLLTRSGDRCEELVRAGLLQASGSLSGGYMYTKDGIALSLKLKSGEPGIVANKEELARNPVNCVEVPLDENPCRQVAELYDLKDKEQRLKRLKCEWSWLQFKEAFATGNPAGLRQAAKIAESLAVGMEAPDLERRVVGLILESERGHSVGKAFVTGQLTLLETYYMLTNTQEFEPDKLSPRARQLAAQKLADYINNSPSTLKESERGDEKDGCRSHEARNSASSR